MQNKTPSKLQTPHKAVDKHSKKRKKKRTFSIFKPFLLSNNTNATAEWMLTDENCLSCPSLVTHRGSNILVVRVSEHPEHLFSMLLCPWGHINNTTDQGIVFWSYVWNIFWIIFFFEALTVSFSVKIWCQFNVSSGGLHLCHKHSQGWICCRLLIKRLTFHVVKCMIRLKILVQKTACFSFPN